MKAAILSASLLAMMLPVCAFAQSAADLRDAAKTPDRILTYGMSYSQQRFSTLKKIDRQTVKRLVPAWSYSLAINVTAFALEVCLRPVADVVLRLAAV